MSASTDSVAALAQLITSGGELISAISDALNTWLTDNSDEAILTSWNAEHRRYKSELSRKLIREQVALDRGWFQGVNPEPLDSQLRELFRESGNRIPEQPKWEPLLAIGWRGAQQKSKSIYETIRTIATTARGIVGLLPSIPECEIDEKLNSLSGKCRKLSQFCPSFEASRIRPLKDVDIRQIRAESKRTLQRHIDEVIHERERLEQFLAMARSKACANMNVFAEKCGPLLRTDWCDVFVEYDSRAVLKALRAHGGYQVDPKNQKSKWYVPASALNEDQRGTVQSILAKSQNQARKPKKSKKTPI